ncbi:hypothetical protein NDU88_003913, partial [Pleurodeles waltl]
VLLFCKLMNWFSLSNSKSKQTGQLQTRERYLNATKFRCNSHNPTSRKHHRRVKYAN